MTAFLLVLSVGIVSAQNVQVKGTVKDAASGESILSFLFLRNKMTGNFRRLRWAFALSVPSDGVLEYLVILDTPKSRSQLAVAQFLM